MNALGLGLQGLQFDYQTPDHTAPTSPSSIRLPVPFRPGLVRVHRRSESAGRRRHQEPHPDSACAAHSSQPFTTFHDFGGGSPATVRPKQVQRPPDEARTAVRQRPLLPAYLHLVQGDVGCGRPAQWRSQPAVCVHTPYPGLVPGSIRRRRTSIFATCSTSAADMNCPSAKDRRYMNTGGIAKAVLGGWAINWIVTLARRTASQLRLSDGSDPEPVATICWYRVRASSGASRPRSSTADRGRSG